MKNVLLHLVVFFSIMVFTAVDSAWSAPAAVYVTEFHVIGANKPEELKKTIQTLLLSRLTTEKIATQATATGAELHVSGSYIASGTVFSLDAVAATTAGAFLARAYTQGNSPDDLIPAVNKLAVSLSEGIAKGVAAPLAPPPAASAVSAVPDIIIPPPTISAAGQLVIHKMPGALTGLALGKTLAHGERELFTIGTQSLRYYHQGAGLRLVAEIPYKVYEQLIAVDSADLDNDGSPEIYVTVMNGEQLASQVWVVDGTALKQIAGPLPYFFRSITGNGGVKKLYGQQISNSADFSGPIAEVVKTGDGYALKNPLTLPKQANLYNFNMITNAKGEQTPIVIERSGSLKVFSAAGDDLWKSSEEFGGSEGGFRRTDLSESSGFRRVFIEQRIILTSSGELFVPRNSSSWFMMNKHSYSKSSLYKFAWNGVDLNEKWHTKQNDYYLADFAYDESSHELLLLEVVAKEEGIFDKGASRLVIRKVD
ncbi:MAG: VCBS repeat-containing protein [Desulfuromonadaceae bacterium]|nr:VCBS repeat-containing protein [Desulfuromonadaceae bacterium]MDD5105174.1 VCBS repeat-containing protein [Desulfuromonadaceae bacterium]